MQEPRLPSGLSSRLLGRWEREASSNVGGDSGVDVFDSLRVRSFKAVFIRAGELRLEYRRGQVSF